MIAKVSPSKPEQVLEKFTDKVRNEFEKVQASVRTALSHALAAGDLLNKAKADAKQAKLPRGKWERWLSKACGVGRRQAQKFMQLARHRDQMEEKLPGWASKLTINEALTKLRKILRDENGKEEQAPRAHTTAADTAEAHARRCERFQRFWRNGELRKAEQKVAELVASDVEAFAHDVVKAAQRHGRQLAQADGLRAGDADPILFGMLLCAQLKIDPINDFAPRTKTDNKNTEQKGEEKLAAATA